MSGKDAASSFFSFFQRYGGFRFLPVGRRSIEDDDGKQF